MSNAKPSSGYIANGQGVIRSARVRRNNDGTVVFLDAFDANGNEIVTMYFTPEVAAAIGAELCIQQNQIDALKGEPR